MQIREYKSEIVSNNLLANSIYEIELKLTDPTEISFQAGQFINIKIPQEKHPLLRSYSIASSPSQKNAIRLCYKKLDQGIASNFLAQLKPRDQLNFVGVFGHFVLNSNSGNDIIMIAGGVGITPLYSIIQQLFEQPATTKKVQLYFSVKTEQDLFYETQLREMEQKYPNFKLMTCLSREEKPHPRHFAGRLNKALDKDLKSIQNLEAYICGSKEMVNDFKDYLVSKGLPSELVFSEKFY